MLDKPLRLRLLAGLVPRKFPPYEPLKILKEFLLSALFLERMHDDFRLVPKRADGVAVEEQVRVEHLGLHEDARGLEPPADRPESRVLLRVVGVLRAEIDEVLRVEPPKEPVAGRCEMRGEREADKLQEDARVLVAGALWLDD